MLIDLGLIFLVFSVVSALYYFYFVRAGFGGIDIWRWMKYALEIKRIKGLPEDVNGYVIKAPFNYPPLFLIFLSFFSRRIIHKFPHLLQLIIWFLELIYVYLFLSHEHYDNALWLTFIFFLVSISRNLYFSSRSLANFFITVLISILLLPASFVTYFVFFVSIIFLLYSHRHGVQFILFLTFFYIYENPVFFLIFCFSYGLMLLSSNFFGKVYKNHIGILAFHRTRLLALPGTSLKFLLINIRRVFISKSPYMFLFLFSYLFNLGDNWIGLHFFYFTVFLTLVYSTKILGFLGEPERNFDYMSLMVVISLTHVPLLQALIVGSFFLVWDVFKWVYKRGSSLYNVNSKPPLFLDELIRRTGNFKRVFFSFPPIFDDYVLYKFENVSVVFHDNGIALGRDPLAYGPNNSTLIDEDQLSYIVNRYSVGVIVLFNRPEYLHYEILKKYRLEYVNDNYLFFSL